MFGFNPLSTFQLCQLFMAIKFFSKMKKKARIFKERALFIQMSGAF